MLSAAVALYRHHFLSHVCMGVKHWHTEREFGKFECSNCLSVSLASACRNTETVGASTLANSLPVMSIFMFYHLFYIVYIDTDCVTFPTGVIW